MSTNAQHTQRRLVQFSLKTLLLLMLLAGIACGWFKWQLVRKQRERAAVAEIEKIGGHFMYDYHLPSASGAPPSPPGPAWLRRRLGDDFFSHVVDVSLVREGVTAEWLTHIEPLTELRTAGFTATRITDEGVRYLTRFKKIAELTLGDETVTDAGLAHLRELPALKRLCLYGLSRATDAGVAPVESLTQLVWLELNETPVTDKGIVHLKALTQLQKLSLHRTAVTDAGLPCLVGLSNLTELCLHDTAVTDAGLVHLRSLSNLRVVDVYGTAVTAAGAARLHEALPNCEIKGL